MNLTRHHRNTITPTAKASHVCSALRAGPRLSDLAQLPISPPPPQPPSEEKINGILLGFRLRYRELLYDRLRSYSAHAISSISAWADLTGEPLPLLSHAATRPGRG